MRGAAWGAVIQDPDGAFFEHAGLLENCFSNTDAEYWAVLKSLQKVPDDGSAVLVMCDCAPVVAGLQRVLEIDSEKLAEDASLSVVPKFMQRDAAFFQDLQIERARLQSINVQWIKGHSGDFGNSKADWLAAQQLKAKKLPFVHDAQKTNGNRKKTDSSSTTGSGPQKAGQLWRSYVSPIGQVLQKQYFALSKGDARKVTQYLCKVGALDASQAYSKKSSGRLPDNQVVAIAKSFQIPQGKAVVRQKNLERQSARTIRRKKNEKNKNPRVPPTKESPKKGYVMPCCTVLSRANQWIGKP